MLGRYSESAAAGERAVSVAEQLSDLPLQVVTNLPLGLTHHTRGDYRRAMEYFRWNTTRLEGERARERFGMFVLPAAFARSFIAWGLAELGEFADAYGVGEDALRIAEEAEHPFSCGYAHLGLGVVALRQGNLRRALRSFERAMAAGAFADSPVGFAYVALHFGYALSLAGRAGEGIPILEQSVGVAESKGFVARHALRLAYVSEAYLVAGRDDAAVAAGLRALELAKKHEERANEAYALRILGKIAVCGGRLPEAEIHFRSSLQLARELGMRPLEAHCHRGLADVFELKRKPKDAAGYREAAAALVQIMQMRFWGD
jgi:tetratricopeptide (TPR) repeat protein